MSKGSKTKSAILRQALDLTSEVGLEGLTIGVLAKRVGMSKSGLYAHFESKEDLQGQVLDTAADLFRNVVVLPALKKPRGMPRLEAIFRAWLLWYHEELSGGCPFLAASSELDDKESPLRDILTTHLNNADQAVRKAVMICVEEGQFLNDLDVGQFAFQFWGILFAFHHFSRLLEKKDAQARAFKAFEQLVRGAGWEPDGYRPMEQDEKGQP